MQIPLVSVIIPVYNSEKTIEFTLGSVCNSTYKNIEIIVIDDGSTDSSKDKILKYVYKDPRIKYFHQTNSGSPKAKNIGLEKSSGSFIQFLDSDDALSSDKIENQVVLLQNKIDAISVCRTKVFYQNEDLKNPKLNEIDSEYLIFSQNPFSFLTNLMGINGKTGMVQPNAFLTPRSLIEKCGNWSEELNRSPDDDSEFFCRVLLNATEVIYDKDSINYYRKSSNTLSLSSNWENALGALKTVKLKTINILSKNNSKRIRVMLAKNYTVIAYKYGVKHPKIISLIKQELLQIGMKKFESVGGTYFKKLSFLIGFEKAMKLKATFEKIKSIIFN